MSNLEKKFLNFLEKFVYEKANGVEIKKYLDPASKEHISYLSNRIFDYQFDLEMEYKKYVFARLVYSWSNGAGKNHVDYNKFSPNAKASPLGIEVRNLLENFDYNKVMKNHKDEVGLFNYVNQQNSPFKLLNGIKRRSVLMEFCEGMFSLIRYMKKIDSELADDCNKLNKNVSVSIFINKAVVENLIGMSWTLLADGIKEAGICDIAKPDTHVNNVINELYSLKEKDRFEKIDSQKEYNRLQNIMINIANNDQSKSEFPIYKVDKLIYIACADFYLDNKKQFVKSMDEKELIKRMKLENIKS